MKRKDFLKKGLATSALIGSAALVSAANDTVKIEQNNKVPRGYDVDYAEVRIERAVKGKPHKGKVLLAIQPHSDDIPLSAGGLVAKLMERLAKEGKKLPILEGDDHTANFNYTKTFVFNRNKKLGEKYGLQWAEGYHYMNEIPFDNNVYNPNSPVEEYIKKNAIPN